MDRLKEMVEENHALQGLLPPNEALLRGRPQPKTRAKEDRMGSITISLIVLAFVFGGALLGMFLRSALPQQHLTDASKDIVRLAVGLVVTMCAMTLGLLVSSAKGAYERQSMELTEVSAKIVFLDRILAHYGPETREARELLRADVVHVLDQVWSEGHTVMDPSSVGVDVLYDKIQELSPKDDAQRSIRAEALGLALAVGRMRWLMYEQKATAVSKPLLVVLVFWLTIVFVSFGLFAPKNPIVVATLFICAFAVSGAILLILEMYTPYGGLIQISSAPLRAALAQLGR
jgi:hypothetical protein